jgi:GNAT superfamily N-acetyltransferase
MKRSLSQQLRNLREMLRWRGPVRFLLLTVREILSPLMYWYVFHIFETDLRLPIPQSLAKEEFDVRIYTGDEDLERHTSELASMGEHPLSEIEARFRRGDVVAVAYDGSEAVGWTWITFASGIELAFGTAWIINPHEALRYGTFVRPEWRGRRIHSFLNHSINTYSRNHGIVRIVGSISVLNSQSMSLAAQYRKAPGMILTIVHIRGVNWTYRNSSGARLNTRFSKLPKPLNRSHASVFSGEKPNRT